MSWWKFKKVAQPKLSMGRLLSSLEEGYIVFDQDGVCLPLKSASATKYLGYDPAGRNILEICQVSEKRHSEFKEWFSFFFNRDLIFSDVADLGPQSIKVDDRHIALKWRPLLGESGEVTGVILITLDDTERSEAEGKLRELKDYSDLVVKFTNDKNMFINFFHFVSEEIARIRASGRDLKKGDVLRFFHSVKGGSASLSMTPIRDICHQIEQDLAVVVDSSPSRADLLVEFSKRIDELEIALRLYQRENRKVFGGVNWAVGTTREVPTDKLLEFARKLNGIVDEATLEQFVEEVVSVPVEDLFEASRASVSATSHRFGKLVYFEVESEDVRLIPENYNTFLNSLIHLFNNMVDHGIEVPGVRSKQGKHETGMIRVGVDLLEYPEAFGVDPSLAPKVIRFVISDDGRGIDPTLVRERMMESQGVDTSSESDEEVLYHIFDHGFSTKKLVTHVSGRGVGLDAVRESVMELGGQVGIQSQVGKGTQFEIVLPYYRRVDVKESEIRQEVNQQWVDAPTKKAFREAAEMLSGVSKKAS